MPGYRCGVALDTAQAPSRAAPLMVLTVTSARQAWAPRLEYRAKHVPAPARGPSPAQRPWRLQPSRKKAGPSPLAEPPREPAKKHARRNRLLKSRGSHNMRSITNTAGSQPAPAEVITSKSRSPGYAWTALNKPDERVPPRNHPISEPELTPGSRQTSPTPGSGCQPATGPVRSPLSAIPSAAFRLGP